MRTDFENIADGDEVTLHPLPSNPLHKKPIKALFAGGYFYCDGSLPWEGPDYYLGDVLAFNEGFTSVGQE